MPRHRASATQDRTRQLVTAALLAALIAGTSWISIPFGPVPVTLQTTFVLLADWFFRLCAGRLVAPISHWVRSGCPSSLRDKGEWPHCWVPPVGS
jgi:hypothetical protein